MLASVAFWSAEQSARCQQESVFDVRLKDMRVVYGLTIRPDRLHELALHFSVLSVAIESQQKLQLRDPQVGVFG